MVKISLMIFFEKMLKKYMQKKIFLLVQKLCFFKEKKRNFYDEKNLKSKYKKRGIFFRWFFVSKRRNQ